MRILTLVVAALPLLAPVAASAQDPSVAGTLPFATHAEAGEDWPWGGSSPGTRGIHRVEGAYAPESGDLILALSGTYSLASDLFTQGDENERHSQHITVVWAPIDNLQLLVRESIVSNRNSKSDVRTTQTIGDPTIGLKYSLPLSSQLGIGGGVLVKLPTSPRGTGLKPDATSLTGYAAVSYLPMSFLAISLNAGYRYDQSNKIFNYELDRVQRFTAGINGTPEERVDAVVAGVGVDTTFELGGTMAIGPFAEVTSFIPIGADFDNGPLRATLGAKLFPFGEDAVELAVGGDYAIMGTPKAGSKMAGVPPWEAFARVIAHIGPKKEDAVASTGPMICIGNDDCSDAGDGYVCTPEQICAKQVLKEVVTEVVKEVEKPTFSIEGGVFDQATGEPIGAATLTFSGFDDSVLAVNYKSGTFKSWPIPVGPGLVKVTAQAPACAAAEKPVQKGKTGGKVAVTFKLQCGELTGEIKGSLKDARTGRPLRGQVFIPILGKKIRTDKEGKFSSTIKVGRYQVLISAKRFATQKKKVEIRAGDTVILNVDMNRR